MKLFIFILLSFCFLNSHLVYASDDHTAVLNSNQEQNLEHAQMLEQAQKSVWKISSFSGRGTGFFISPNEFVTNFHVVAATLAQNSYEFTLNQKGVSKPLKIKKVKHLSPLYDLTILETEGKVSDYLNLAQKNPHPKENLFLVGYPGGEFKIINKTSDISYEDELEYIFSTDNSYNAGASGAPVLNSKGEVVGVVYGSGANELATIKITHLQNLLKQEPHSFENPKDHLERSIKELRQKAERGEAIAQFRLGVLHDNGRGVKEDPKEAARWYRLAAEQGHATAQSSLGVSYANSWGVEQDPKEAARWFEAAAEQGFVPAQANLGIAYAKGWGVEQDFEEAARWFRLAAKQGHAEAQYNMGVSYANSWGVEQDFEEAARWFRPAAKQGHAEAQFQLGLSYAYGDIVEKDYREAFHWILKAADQGHAEARKIIEYPELLKFK